MRQPKTSSATIKDVEVVPELCLNFRNCVRIARGAFMTDPKSGKTRAARWQQVDPELLWQAGWSCPSGAIRLVTDQGTIVPRWDEAAHWDVSRHPAAARQRDEPQEKW